MVQLTTYAGPVKPIVGVLGGMGPAATVDFLSKLLSNTPVTTESDHLPVAVWCNPEIPDRTQALLGIGPSPMPAMADGARRLADLGADPIVIPCNTAHVFLDELRTQVQVEFLDMIDATLATVLTEHRDAHIGILSTAGTQRTGLYAAECQRRGLACLELSEVDQVRLVDPAIRAVKLGSDYQEAASKIQEAATVLADLGATVLIAGCTEIPLVAHQASEVLPIVDATDCLAQAVVRHMHTKITNRLCRIDSHC